MSWSHARRPRSGLTPAHCNVWRTEIVPRLDVLRLVAHDEVRPELDGSTTAIGGSLLVRWTSGSPGGRTSVDINPGLFIAPSTHKPGAHLAVSCTIDVLFFGPELWVVTPREVRAMFDIGLRFAI